jgi:hypothetical protein
MLKRDIHSGLRRRCRLAHIVPLARVSPSLPQRGSQLAAELGKVMAVDFPEGKLEKSSGLGNNVFYAKLPV